MSNERFIVDTAGTLIDMITRDTFDYVSDVKDLLNDLNDEVFEANLKILELKKENEKLKELLLNSDFIEKKVTVEIK